MSDDLSAIASVGEPAPEFLRLAGLGAGLRGTIAPATVVIREEFRPEEWSAFESGRYVVGVKIYHRSGVVGLVLELVAPGSTMQFYLNYSLAHVAAMHGAEALAEVVDSLDQYKRSREPGLGLMVFLVFLGLDDGQTVRALRAFAMPRMFGDRFLAAVETTVAQELDAANAIGLELCGNTRATWAAALPGVAVAGEEIEQTEGEYVRFKKSARARR